MDLPLLLVRFAGDVGSLILLYDFFVQPFRFYGMDPLTRFIWIAARWICAPFETISRKIIQVPDRDLTPLFSLVIILFCRGLLYAAAAALDRPNPVVILLGVTLSFQELFTRLLIPSLLFIIYIDIQLSRHQETFMGNVLVMMLHDLAKRFVVQIRRLLYSYRPLQVFLTVFVILWIFRWLLLVVTLLPFQDTQALSALPGVLYPEGVDRVGHPLLFLPVVFLQMARTFLFGIFILLLLHMVTSFSGMNPYDRTTMLLGLTIYPWVTIARRLFPFARLGVIDFSIGILIFLLWLLLDLLTYVVARLG
jgi:hypothetical protein